MLAGATALIAWISEILVGSVEGAAHAFGMTRVFIGVIVVAVVGNAAEHSTAVMMAMKNRMELSMGIAIGSSLQIALFVAPLLVIVSHFMGPRPMDLVFTPAEVLAIFLAVLITGPDRFGRRIELARGGAAAGGLCDPGDRVLLPAGGRQRGCGALTPGRTTNAI